MLLDKKGTEKEEENFITLKVIRKPLIQKHNQRQKFIIKNEYTRMKHKSNYAKLPNLYEKSQSNLNN
jgi:hypothetical protein